MLVVEVIPPEAVAELRTTISCPNNARSCVVTVTDPPALMFPRSQFTGPPPEQEPCVAKAETSTNLPVSVWLKVYASDEPLVLLTIVVTVTRFPIVTGSGELEPTDKPTPGACTC